MMSASTTQGGHKYMQFSFMKGKGTIDTIFVVGEMQEKLTGKSKKLDSGFVDLEKTFDSLLREVI